MVGLVRMTCRQVTYHQQKDQTDSFGNLTSRCVCVCAYTPYMCICFYLYIYTQIYVCTHLSNEEMPCCSGYIRQLYGDYNKPV